MNSIGLISFVTVIMTLQLCFGHMSMQYPYPRDNNGAYAKWKANEPMITVHPMICHGIPAKSTVREGNVFTVGDTISIDMYGSASHNGGHCTFWYSTDDITFTKIIDIKDCTLNPTTVTLPTTMPTECTTKCTFAFTWVPASSGACEIYMNCADIKVNGASGGNPNPITLNFKTSFIDQSANGYGCSRVNDGTHWTNIFGALKTEYDQTKPVNPVDVVNPDASNEDTRICYAQESLAINLDNDIDNLGTCGSGSNAYRCDDGMCCSPAGYCGPDYDGVGWINYDLGGYYDNTNDAYGAYCTNAIGDWRVVTCESETQSVGYMVSVFLSNCVVCVLVVVLLLYT